MSTIDRNRIQELMGQAASLSDGAAKVALLEEAVRQADMLADTRLGFDARTRLTEATIFSGSPEKSIVAFSWCLAQVDRDPETFPAWQILWQYKWIIDHLPTFPQVSRAQIEGALDDLERRLEREGQGIRPVLKLRFQAALFMGEPERARQGYETWRKSPRGAMSDCPACDLDAEIEYLTETRSDAEAVARAAPILAGTMKCRTVPHRTFPKLLLPLVRLGRVAEAMPLHHKGHRLIAKNPAFLVRMAQHLEFLALTDNMNKGLRLFGTEFRFALETADLGARFTFANASRFLFERLQAAGKKSSRLRLPESFPIYEASGQYAIPALIAWFEADAAAIAARFDARNGNDAFSQLIASSRALEALITPFPLRGGSPGDPA